jgi:hypothetical protein
VFDFLTPYIIQNQACGGKEKNLCHSKEWNAGYPVGNQSIFNNISVGIFDAVMPLE